MSVTMFVFVCLFLDCFLYIKIAIHSVCLFVFIGKTRDAEITASHEGTDKKQRFISKINLNINEVVII